MARRQIHRKLTLAEYVRRRNGLPLGASGSLTNMLNRSLGAGTFGGFWEYWNPIFGYTLGRYVYGPLQAYIPAPLALVITFVVCGAVHDLVTTLVRGSIAFLFTPWFFLMGLGVLVGKSARINFSNLPWTLRAGINLLYVGVCLVLTVAFRRMYGIV